MNAQACHDKKRILSAQEKQAYATQTLRHMLQICNVTQALTCKAKNA